jgi:hypothetical protein
MVDAKAEELHLKGVTGGGIEPFKRVDVAVIEAVIRRSPSAAPAGVLTPMLMNIRSPVNYTPERAGDGIRREPCRT